MSTPSLWSSQYFNSHRPGGNGSHEVKRALYMSSSSFIVFSWLFCLILLCIFPPSYETIFIMLFFFSTNASFRGGYPHNYLRLQPMEKRWEKEGKQSQVRSQCMSSGQRSASFKHVHHSLQTDAGFAPIWMPRMISQYHPLRGEELAVWWTFPSNQEVKAGIGYLSLQLCFSWEKLFK